MSNASTTSRLNKIAVLVSIGRHPVSGTARYSRNDAAALTLATKLATQHQATLDVLHAGDPTSPALREYLALGAAKVEVLAVATGDEIAPALNARLKGYDLILTGTRAEGTEDSGMLPYQLADALNIPLLASAVDIDVEAGQVTVRQFLPKGLRRRVQASLPALVAVHPMANATPRYAYAKLREGTIEKVLVSAANASDVTAWSTKPVTAKPIRLAAAEKRSGHARMLSATTTESRGGSVVIEGTFVEKAQVILAYLREHQLVDY
ncbi:electron transfer flavoprotein subunit beta/FixA family protein [Caballeronia sp. SEWSISQ10-4 2]|uniref:electron transfer flavoprotein subunit beta/FixA family protein n=1 Tax=Caballeronia sp. SEWSISQ10-4 2 TaxID=2937438 RepID=UPI00265632F1|nr:electron transfer flavoprotein subunit beta/FixA family protein [Caballeronia sp. SEWSISQ10-4 2]MDN7183641.1 electron transfer flavoprotein subunit beta/FixA family protein [Caballeronia sp. SEWSISQ10-4 2]